MLLYGVSVTFAACAITISLGRSWQTGVALLAASAVLVILVHFTGYFGDALRAGRSGPRVYDSTTERLRADLFGHLRALEAARSEREVMDVLREVAAGCSCEQVEVRSGSGIRSLASARNELAGAALVSYPLGPDIRARARVEFVWESAEQRPSPSAAILVQVLIDAAAHALGRCSSSLAPAPEGVESERLPAAVPIVPSSTNA